MKVSEMTLFSQDELAAQTYLEYWQESEAHEVDQDLLISLEIKLVTLGYPHPNDIVFDNEAMPWVKWKSEEFDWEEWNSARIEDFL